MGWEHNKYFKNCKKILDAGFGEGEMILAFPKKRIFGIDLDEKVVKKAKKQGYSVWKASVTDMPFNNNFFDGIISSHVIEHLLPKEVLKMMQESSRVLKPNGIFMIRTPVFNKNFYRQNYDHIKPYPPECIKRLLRDYDLNLQLEEVIYDFKFPFHKLLHKIFNTLMKKKKQEVKKQVAQGKQTSLSKIIRITQILAKIPFMKSGYTMILRKNGG